VYPFARLDPNQRGEMVVHFKDNAKGSFLDCRGGQGAWPGLWIENAVQAVSRDLLVEAMQRLETAGYSVVMTVHDEIVAEMPAEIGSKEEFISIMTKAPVWAKGLSGIVTTRAHRLPGPMMAAVAHLSSLVARSRRNIKSSNCTCCPSTRRFRAAGLISKPVSPRWRIDSRRGA
jgi:hypothetical protein